MVSDSNQLKVYLTERDGRRQLCWDYVGEDYGCCSPDETPVQFEVDGPFVGVARASLVEYTWVALPDPDDSHEDNIRRLKQFCAALMAIEDLEFTAKAALNFALASRCRALRKHLFVSEMVANTEMVAEEADRRFEENELKMEVELDGPYGRRDSKTGNG